MTAEGGRRGLCDVAQAIGSVIWGSRVEPKGKWLEAAEAAIAAYEEAKNKSPNAS